MPIIFEGSEKRAYRDPACYFYGGEYHLFFTVSEKDNGYMYKILTGQRNAPKIVAAICEILNIKGKEGSQ